MEAPEKIYYFQDAAGTNRVWLKEMPNTKTFEYIRADLYEQLQQENESLKDILEAVKRGRTPEVQQQFAEMKAQLQQRVPDPTAEMIAAGDDHVMIIDSAEECAEKVYRAMLNAAPQPPEAVQIEKDLLDDELQRLETYCHIYNSGYMHGHHSTVEGMFSDIASTDFSTYHADEVIELIECIGLAPQEQREGDV